MITFKKVWYNSKGIAPFWGTSFEDIGTLIITDDSLEFIADYRKIEIMSGDMLDVSSGKLRGNPAPWILLRVKGDPQPVTHYFKKMEGFGWAESPELMNALQDLASPKKKCPHCTEVIRSDATVCKHCGRDLPLSPSRI